MKKISIVVPVYNEEANISPLFKELQKIQEKKYAYEIIFVDDGSTDKTLNRIESLSKKNKQVKYLSFSRNFGHQIALKAGVDFVSGDCVVYLDGDLQHPPKYIRQMVKLWESGYDVVFTVRKDDKDTAFLKKMTSKLFYKLLNSISDVKIKPGSADFRLLDRKVVAVLKPLNETSFFIRGLVPWSGFRQTDIFYKADKRNAGETKYTFVRMLLLALDGITALSVKPLRIATFVGFFFAIISGLYGIYAIVVRIFYSQAIVGWASLVASVVFMGGLQLMILGIIGEYLGKLFIQSKNRPLYIVKKTNLPV